MRRLGLIVLALALAGCGVHTDGPATVETVSGTSGPFSAEASPARLHAGATVHLTLTVTGPIDYEVGCVQTLHIWTGDSQNRQVWEEPLPAIQCMAFGHRVLNAGETATFSADWPTSSQLSPGPYTIHGLFLTVLPMGAGMRVRENLPPLTVQVLA